MATIAPSVATPFAGNDRTFLYSSILLALFVFAISLISSSHFTVFHFKDQDRPVLVGLVLLLAFLHAAPPFRAPLPRRPSPRLLAAGLGAVAMLLWALTHALMSNFGVSYDEYMVLFDGEVYRSGQLAAPLAPEWRDYARNLVPAFLLNEVRPDAMVSAYLPMNALMRLGFSHVLPATLMNPLLFAIGGIALMDIARRQFGEDRSAILMAFLLYALSMQAWTAAMTPYAMTGHLALNLVWLAAFLRGGRWHLLAIATGFIAAGLHQVVFHPLFVAPFLLQRLMRGDWRLVAMYTLAYAAICGWWVYFPVIVSAYTGTSLSGTGSHASFFQDRLLPLLLDRNPFTLLLMVMNMLRFFAWQHLALLPLVALSAHAIARGDGITRPLLGGILLTLAVIALLLPYQGHGWGYRYLHGFIGSFAILGAYGYRRLRQIAPSRATGAMVLTTLATFLAMIWHVGRIDAFVAPHVALERRLAAIDADLIIIETEPAFTSSDGQWPANAIDLVRNRPDLSNPTLRLSSQRLTPDSVAALCSRGSIALVDRSDQRSVGFSLNQPGPSRRFDALRARLEAEARAGRCRLV